jgi:hypothetical protein
MLCRVADMPSMLPIEDVTPSHVSRHSLSALQERSRILPSICQLNCLPTARDNRNFLRIIIVIALVLQPPICWLYNPLPLEEHLPGCQSNQGEPSDHPILRQESRHHHIIAANPTCCHRRNLMQATARMQPLTL